MMGGYAPETKSMTQTPRCVRSRCPAGQGPSPGPPTEGQRWTADALLELRRSRYRPSAWRHFIARSLQRSNETRRTRPELARQARLWGLAGAVAWIATCRTAGRRGVGSPSVSAGLLWWASVWKMLDWHLGMLEGDCGEPRTSLSQADAMTLSRFWLVPLLPALRRSSPAFPATIAAGGVSDWLDGALAHGCGSSRLGRDLDTTADLAFFATATVSGRATGRISGLGAYALLARYALGTLLALWTTFGLGRRPAISARRWGGALRVGGLVFSTVGYRRIGTALLVGGCLAPPKPSAALSEPGYVSSSSYSSQVPGVAPARL
jgi:phosphatidylglycerophosphate synthase